MKSLFILLLSAGAALAADGRVQVDTASRGQSAFRSVGVVYSPTTSYYGTGFLISPCHVLTNYHIVSGGDDKEFKEGEEFEFAFNADKDGRLRGLAKGRVVGHSKSFTVHRNRHSDWAVIRLVHAAHVAQPLRMMKMPYDLARKLNLRMLGFPGDKIASSNKYHLWSQTCVITANDATGWIGTCKTSVGDSGSPIAAAANDGGYVVVAINAAGPRVEGDPLAASSANTVTPIQSVHDEVIDVMAKNKCSP